MVIVSIEEFKEDPNSFWNISISVDFSDTEIQILTQGEDLGEKLYSMIYLWITPTKANYTENPIPEDEVSKLIESNTLKIEEENKKVEEQQKLAELKEQKKYEESWITEWLKVINDSIDHIEQLIKAWEWIISWNELKELEDYLNEMKKIRLWTNFNKMAAMVLESHAVVESVENRIFEANKDKSFLIDKNSCVSNIDVLSEYFHSNRIAEKVKFQSTELKSSDSLSNMLWSSGILVGLLKKDLSFTFDNSTIDEVFAILLELIEYIVAWVIIVISLMRLVSWFIWMGNFSLYLLPAMWWLGLLIYLLNNLKLKWILLNIVWFAVLVLIYWRWLKLLLNTFAL